MTLVLSMNPFLDPEGDPPLSTYQPIWESERCTKTCLSNPGPPCSSEEQFTQGINTNVHLDAVLQVAPVLEERAHVLRLSLEKMRFIDDPEAFLRRSVLVNNLLRRLRAEILLQSTDWCFPPNPAFATGQGDVRPDCAQTCCCIYAAAAAAGHYLHLPFSMYDAALSTCPSTPHSSSFFQLASQSKLGLTVAVDDHDDEDEDIEEEEHEEEEEREEEEEEDDERRQAGPSADVKEKSSQKSRTRTLLGHAHARTGDSCMADRVEEEEGEEEEEEEDEEEEEEQVVRPCQWDSTSSERELHKFSFWHRRAHRQ
uniref:SERTA domain containing 4 n=1 Tax=Amphiprion percula TaxID=161767 RepID=A0A3P8TLV9_AMPPE